MDIEKWSPEAIWHFSHRINVRDNEMKYKYVKPVKWINVSLFAFSSLSFQLSDVLEAFQQPVTPPMCFPNSIPH